ncbi:MOSC domain-containing protein (plasmid) [Ensifer adhaerens]|uniref:MOSC domain-containing protein n=1 Tax=Ensifer adhaerens TaxID=106592 RepID=UPI0023A91A9A|nr:MOSC domain-containing protein [Ensifer adhaerens]WDZ81863.1 MOSC domain-containing protein [Ensifer adhaerens]
MAALAIDRCDGGPALNSDSELQVVAEGGRMRVLAVCVGIPEDRPGKTVRTGIHKQPINFAMSVTAEGLEDDAVCNRKHHGGPEQALCVEGNITRLWWEGLLNKAIPPGFFGENLCIEGLDNRIVALGDHFSIGNVVLEATAPRMPCRTLCEWLGDPAFAKRYLTAARPGFYCRVIESGRIAAGSSLKYEPFEGDRILLSEMMKHHGKRASPDLIHRYLTVPVHAKVRASLAQGSIKS